MKLRVFYSPTPSNKVIVAKLKTLGKLRFCEFIPLSEEQHVRTRQLRAIRGRAVYLWGDGEFHHESYYFTERQGIIKLKINIDYHTDDSGVGRELDCANHMRRFRSDGKRILIPEPRVNCSKKQSSNLMRMMLLAKEIGSDYYENEIALTIDWDGITGMPVLPKWLTSMGTISHAEIIDLMRALDCRIFRLDMGGIIDELPDFELGELYGRAIVSRGDLIPFYCEVFPGSGLGSVIPKEELFSIVGSYVVKVYADMLEAFLHIHKSVLGIQEVAAHE